MSWTRFSRKGKKGPRQTLHGEAFSKSRAKLNRCKADLKRLTEEWDALKLLIVQREEEIKDLWAELATTHKGQTHLIKQKAKKIEQLHEEDKMKKAKTLGWKQNMDRLASEKEVAWAQLSSAEHQLQSMKEENLSHTKKIEELEAHLVAELAKTTFEAEKTKADVEAVMVVYRADAEAAHAQEKEIFDATLAQALSISHHARCQFRRETLKKIHAHGFGLAAEIESAKVLEAKARALHSFDDDDSGSASRSESGEDEDKAHGED